MMTRNSLARAFLVAAMALATGRFAAHVRADDTADPREKLATAIPEAIRLLEAKDYKTMLSKFIDPATMKKIMSEVTLDQLADRFAASKADDLLKLLKSIKNQKPELSDDGKQAKFTSADPKARPVSFEKIDRYWYIKN